MHARTDARRGATYDNTPAARSDLLTVQGPEAWIEAHGKHVREVAPAGYTAYTLAACIGEDDASVNNNRCMHAHEMFFIGWKNTSFTALFWWGSLLKKFLCLNINCYHAFPLFSILRDFLFSTKHSTRNIEIMNNNIVINLEKYEHPREFKPKKAASSLTNCLQGAIIWLVTWAKTKIGQKRHYALDSIHICRTRCRSHTMILDFWRPHIRGLHTILAEIMRSNTVVT